MNPLWNIPQLLITAWLGKLTREQQQAYQAAVEQQIAEGRSGLEARSRAAVAMAQNDPNSNEAQAILKKQMNNLPANVRADAKKASAQWARREKDVMGYLEGIGTQAKKDTERVFGEESGKVYGDLVSRGLAGGGVGASIAHGFATRKADALNRLNEGVGELKASTLAGLRGDTQLATERAFNTAYGFDESTANAYANTLLDRGQNVQDVYLDTTGDYWDFRNNIQNVPPDQGPFIASAGAAGRGAANFGY